MTTAQQEHKTARRRAVTARGETKTVVRNAVTLRGFAAMYDSNGVTVECVGVTVAEKPRFERETSV